MYKEINKTEQTPYLSGGYLNWVVHNQKCEKRAILVNKALFSRPRERRIFRSH